MENRYQAVFYVSRRGDCPLKEFLDLLPVKVKAKISKWIQKLEELGPDLPRPYADIVKGKVRELRVGFAGNQYRILYFFCYKSIILTHAFIKKTDKVPENEIGRAERIMFDFEQRIKTGDVVL